MKRGIIGLICLLVVQQFAVCECPAQTRAGGGKGEWKDPVTGMEFVWVPAGCYEMGCGTWTDNCSDHEKPVHKVCVDGFWLGKYEVTQAQWKAVMGNNPSGCEKGDQYPVEEVSWNDIKDYIRKLSAKSKGRGVFRLPTEAEWEYACRSGGKKVKYPWGSELGKNRANCDGCGSKWDNNSTAPVGSFEPNALGLYDMAGNVWEWCEDAYHENAYSEHGRYNPVYRQGDSNRVLRGGSWYSNQSDVRCAIRVRSSPTHSNLNLGFRLLMVAP